MAQARAFLCVPGRELSDETKTGNRGEAGPHQSRSGQQPLLRAQLPEWGSDNGGRAGSRRLCYQDAGQVEELGIPTLCPYTEGEASSHLTGVIQRGSKASRSDSLKAQAAKSG